MADTKSSRSRFERYLTTALLTPLTNPMRPLDLDSCDWGIPVNLIGDSGVGKSKIIRDIGSAIGQPLWSIFTSTKSPEHFGGVFVPGADGEVHVVCGLPQVRDAMICQGGILFMDEISCAPAAVQAALLSFVNERQVGEYMLPSKTRIILAMNPADYAAHGQDLETPFANRMAHYNFPTPTFNEWKEYEQGRYVPKVLGFQDGEQRVKNGWDTHYLRTVGTVCSFMESNGLTYEIRTGEKKDGKPVTVKKSKLHNRPDIDDPQAGGAWPSHRTWSMAIRGITTARCLGMGAHIELDLVESLVGHALAVEWASYTAKGDLPTPQEALDPSWVLPTRMDILKATGEACASWVLGRPTPGDKLAMAEKCWLLLKRIADEGYMDTAVSCAKILIQGGLGSMDCKNPAVIAAADEVCAPLITSGAMEHLA